MADPFDMLRRSDQPVSPNPAFAADLRRRLVALLDPQPPTTSGGTVTLTDRATPVKRSLRPYIAVRGAAEAIAFYAGAFGATTVGEAYIAEDGRIGHAELDIDGASFYLSDEYPEIGVVSPLDQQGHTVALHLEVADADATVDRAVALGARVERAVAEQSYGSRSGTIVDPFGHRWMIDALGPPQSDEEHRRRVEADGYRLETLDLGERLPADEPGPAPAAGVPGASSIGYFTVDVADGARAAAFYGALFGWDAQTGSQPDGYHIANIDPPGGINGGAGAPGTTLFFRVDDLPSAIARVRELGGRVVSEEAYASGGNAVCVDDQGVTFNLWQPAPGF
jgi:uncharacterized glyoxalase superfamily protein PhnB